MKRILTRKEKARLPFRVMFVLQNLKLRLLFLCVFLPGKLVNINKQ
jgi:hypothetical protein